MRRVETDGTIMLASEIWRLEKVNTVWCGGKCGVIRDQSSSYGNRPNQSWIVG